MRRQSWQDDCRQECGKEAKRSFGKKLRRSKEVVEGVRGALSHNPESEQKTVCECERFILNVMERTSAFVIGDLLEMHSGDHCCSCVPAHFESPQRAKDNS